MGRGFDPRWGHEGAAVIPESRGRDGRISSRSCLRDALRQGLSKVDLRQLGCCEQVIRGPRHLAP